MNTAKLLHKAESWKELAKVVADVGYESDLTYYYLGRSAEGLGFREAALKYYELSTLSKMKCGVAFNICNGINLPSEASDRIKLVQTSMSKKQKASVSPNLTYGQNKLATLGYYNGLIDGVYGAKTRTAIINFQKDHNLSSTGILNSSTLEKLKKVPNPVRDNNAINISGGDKSEDHGEVIVEKDENKPQSEGSHITLKSDTQVMKAPVIFSEVLTNVKKGEIVKILSTESEWYKVQYNNIIGYMNREDW